MDANSEPQILAQLKSELLYVVEHFESHFSHRRTMSAGSIRHAAGNHVGVSNCLDLLELVFLSQAIELGKNTVEKSDDIGRSKPHGARREINYVGKKDRHVVEMIGDDLIRILF